MPLGSGPAPGQGEQPSAGAYLRLVGLAVLIGAPAGLWTDLPNELGYSSPPWYLVVGLPVVGAALVAAARALLPGDGGHEPLQGLSSATTRSRTGRAWPWPLSPACPSVR